MGAE
jgi:hypothetical protein